MPILRFVAKYAIYFMGASLLGMLAFDAERLTAFSIMALVGLVCWFCGFIAREEAREALRPILIRIDAHGLDDERYVEEFAASLLKLARRGIFFTVGYRPYFGDLHEVVRTKPWDALLAYEYMVNHWYGDDASLPKYVEPIDRKLRERIVEHVANTRGEVAMKAERHRVHVQLKHSPPTDAANAEITGTESAESATS